MRCWRALRGECAEPRCYRGLNEPGSGRELRIALKASRTLIENIMLLPWFSFSASSAPPVTPTMVSSSDRVKGIDDVNYP